MKAGSFKEIKTKAENLTEQGREAQKQVQTCQARVASCSSRVAAARRQLAAASETDENGNPRGDVAQARAALHVAENMLEDSQSALSEARSHAERVKQAQTEHVRTMESHTRAERGNLEKIRRLQSMAFGENADELAQGIAERTNELEDARVELLRSMGIEATPEYVSAGGAGSGWGGFERTAALDVAGQGDGGKNPEGILQRIGRFFGFGKSNDTTDYSGRTYGTLEELSEEVYERARDYQEHHHDKYNDPMRRHESSDEIEALRRVINGHQFAGDKVLYRRASFRDLGEALSGIPPEELAGRCYQFEGIMSTSGSKDLPNSVSHENVMYELKVPAGTQGLDLTEVVSFEEAMLDSPFCYIESVSQEGNTTHVVARILSAGTGLNQVRDFDGLEQYMGSKYGLQMDGAIKQLDFHTVKNAIGGVESVVREYPDVGNLLKTAVVSDSGVMSCCRTKLSFNPSYFSDDQTLHHTCKENAEARWWIPNASPTSIGAHEAAHGVENALIEANPSYTTDEQKRFAWNNCTEATKIVKSACAVIRQTPYGVGKTDQELARSISRYAGSNDSETMAEAFADVFANGRDANPLSKEIKRFTKVFMNSYKGGQ